MGFQETNCALLSWRMPSKLPKSSSFRTRHASRALLRPVMCFCQQALGFNPTDNLQLTIRLTARTQVEHPHKRLPDGAQAGRPVPSNVPLHQKPSPHCDSIQRQGHSPDPESRISDAVFKNHPHQSYGGTRNLVCVRSAQLSAQLPNLSSLAESAGSRVPGVSSLERSNPPIPTHNEVEPFTPRFVSMHFIDCNVGGIPVTMPEYMCPASALEAHSLGVMPSNETCHMT